ncbi:DUF3883 domain-containing protein [Candidatus Pelagibacter bacterium]|nr:DUF3883 domain-containing protein [Candidatus Pelagibacter bacterium]MDA8831694.1 DUF3883 domain-containing protein [Candidatus Pelagibacter bacterium]
MNYDIFENLEYSNIKNLYNLCIENQSNLSLVKKNYVRNNKNLQETLNFLIDLEVLSINGNSFQIKKNEDFKSLLLEQLISNPKYAFPLKEYLKNFLTDEQIVSFKPNIGYNILTSSLRNFLITTKSIKHEIEDDIYKLLDQSLVNKVKNFEFSPESLDLEIIKQKLLGLEAEKLVFINEQEEVFKLDKDLKPDHVSLRDVSAGYDIKSYSKIDGQIKEIFIEVKAVSSSNYKFQLSSGEYQKAIKNLKTYFLYLLPVDYSSGEKFNYEKILKINNLQSNIFDNKNYWTHQNDGYLVYKNN